MIFSCLYYVALYSLIVPRINFVVPNGDCNWLLIMSEFSNILNDALTGFPNSIFYIIGVFNYDLFSINSNN